MASPASPAGPGTPATPTTPVIQAMPAPPTLTAPDDDNDNESSAQTPPTHPDPPPTSTSSTITKWVHKAQEIAKSAVLMKIVEQCRPFLLEKTSTEDIKTWSISWWKSKVSFENVKKKTETRLNPEVLEKFCNTVAIVGFAAVAGCIAIKVPWKQVATRANDACQYIASGVSSFVGKSVKAAWGVSKYLFLKTRSCFGGPKKPKSC